MQRESFSVRHLDDSEDIRTSWPLMRQLRPNQSDEMGYVQQVKMLQQNTGYNLVGAFDPNGRLLGIAGFVFSAMLSRGSYLYVEDLVIDEGNRSQGVGGFLLSWLGSHAREQGCSKFAFCSRPIIRRNRDSDSSTERMMPSLLHSRTQSCRSGKGLAEPPNPPIPGLLRPTRHSR